jgi:glycosyltransferase involved in cell wall biosynthesis
VAEVAASLDEQACNRGGDGVSSRPPRIARVITRLNIGGPSIQAIDLTTQLTASGFATCLIHGQLAEGEGDMTALMPLGAADAIYVDALVRPISPVNDLRAFWRLYRELCRWQPDIVHTHMAKAGALARLAALFYNRTRGRVHPAKLIHTYHGHVFEGYFGSPSTRVFLLIERWLARRSHALIAISPQVKKDLLETYRVGTSPQVRQIALGFNLDRLLAVQSADRSSARALLAIADGEIVVTTVGRLTAIKQHSLFLDMAADLARRRRRYVFLIVGDGELRRDLERRAESLGIAACVRFLGWRGDLPTIYAATDVFVLTSRNEGTPVALIEAMAAAVASVSTDVGGVRDVITGADLGSIVPFGDPVALADAVESLSADPSGRATIGERARASVRDRFHAKRLIEDIKGLYCELLGISGTIASERT